MSVSIHGHGGIQPQKGTPVVQEQGQEKVQQQQVAKNPGRVNRHAISKLPGGVILSRGGEDKRPFAKPLSERIVSKQQDAERSDAALSKGVESVQQKSKGLSAEIQVLKASKPATKAESDQRVSQLKTALADIKGVRAEAKNLTESAALKTAYNSIGDYQESFTEAESASVSLFRDTQSLVKDVKADIKAAISDNKKLEKNENKSEKINKKLNSLTTRLEQLKDSSKTSHTKEIKKHLGTVKGILKTIASEQKNLNKLEGGQAASSDTGTKLDNLRSDAQALQGTLVNQLASEKVSSSNNKAFQGLMEGFEGFPSVQDLKQLSLLKAKTPLTPEQTEKFNNKMEDAVFKVAESPDQAKSMTARTVKLLLQGQPPSVISKAVETLDNTRAAVLDNMLKHRF